MPARARAGQRRGVHEAASALMGLDFVRRGGAASQTQSQSHLEDVLLGAVEEQDEVVAEGTRAEPVGQRAQQLHHHRARDAVVAGAYEQSTRTQLKQVNGTRRMAHTKSITSSQNESTLTQTRHGTGNKKQFAGALSTVIYTPSREMGFVRL